MHKGKIPIGFLPFGTTVLVEVPFEDAPAVAKLRPAMVISHDRGTATVLVAPISRSHRRDLKRGWFGLYADDQSGRLLREASLKAESAVDVNRLVRIPLHRPHFHQVLGYIDFSDPELAKRLFFAARETASFELITKAVLQALH
jgi:hypothetical protein